MYSAFFSKNSAPFLYSNEVFYVNNANRMEIIGQNMPG